MTSRAPTEDQAVSGAAIESIANVVRASIRDGSVDVGSLAGLAKAVASAVASHAGGPALDALSLTEAVIVEVAKGADGQLGTDDDLLPETVVNAVRLLASQGVMRDIASLSLGSSTPAVVGKAFGGCCGSSATKA